jgi:Tol biopolymer transport system component
MRRAIATIAISAASVAALAPTAAAHPGGWASDNGVLVFRSDRDGRPDIFTVGEADADAATSLTSGGGFEDSQPAWAPDGTMIAYVRTNREGGKTEIYVMNASGGARVRVTTTPVPEIDPAWSPDGTRLAYAARTTPAGPFRIFVSTVEGTQRTQLTAQTNGRVDRSPVFSPDGTRIAFVSDRAGGFPELYVMNADGSGLRRLTDNDVIDGNPTWSPDSSRIAVESCCAGGSSEIYIVDVATRARTNVTATASTMEFDPSWSPDGARIAFVAFEVGQPNIDVWTMAADGTARTRVTSNGADDLAPDWQPLPRCTIRGTTGADELLGTDGPDVICGGGGADHVEAGAGADLVYGGRDDDTLNGMDGADILHGEHGADVLGGGASYDVLDGGVGTDTCLRGGQGGFLRFCEV